MSFLFGGGKKKDSPVAQAASVTDESGATKQRARRTGRSALIASNQQDILSQPTTGRSILTAG